MRAVPSGLLAWAQSRPQSWYQVDFYEFGLTNGEILRYCTYPKMITLIDPPQPGGPSAITVTPLGGSGEAFNGIFSTTGPATFNVATGDGVTLMVVATIPGQSTAHILPTITASGVTWSLIAQNLALNANEAVQVYAANTTAGSVSVSFGGPGFPLGIIGRMVVYSIGVSQAVGTPTLDSDPSFPATASTLSSSGVGSISGLSTTTTLPMIIAINSQANTVPVASQVPNSGWANVKGVYDNSPNPSSWVSDPISIAVTYDGTIGHLSSSTVSPWPTLSVSENALTLVAIGNGTAPPAPTETTWIGDDVQVTASSGGKGDKGAGIPTWKCSLGGSADQIDIMVGYWSSESGQQSVIGATPWPVAVRLGMLDNAAFTKYTAFWNSPADLLAEHPPIGYGDLDQYGNASNGLINLFQGYVSAASDVNRQTAKLSIRDSRMQLDVDYPRDRFSDTCVHRLFDQGCTLSPASFSATGTMGSPTETGFTWTSGLAAGTFALGRIEYTDPTLGDISIPISQDSGTAIVLMQPFPAIPASGQAFTAFYGCDKTTGTQGCAKFSNLAHFLGFPFVPPPRTTI